MKTIFFPTASDFDLTVFKKSGLNITRDASIAAEHIVFAEMNLAECEAYCNQFGLPLLNKPLLNRDLAQGIFQKYGFPVIPTIKPLSENDLSGIDLDANLLVKPSQSNLFAHIGKSPIGQIAYKKISKRTLLSVIGMDVDFWANQATENSYIVQEYLEPTQGTSHHAMLLMGAVNGTGDVYVSNPVLGDRVYNGPRDFSFVSVWSSEHLNDATRNCQDKLKEMLIGESIKNAFFNIQFLLRDGKYVPHDFQYRFGYHEIALSKDFGHDKYFNDLLRFAFDEGSTMPVQPFVTAMRLTQTQQQKRVFAYAEDAATALNNLNNLP
jgi:hypothetical protein